MPDYSLRSSRKMFSRHSPGDRWTTEERNRLSHLRNLHSHLSWTQFHQLNFFPHRSQIALYSEYMRMEKVNARKRLQLGRERPNGQLGLRTKRPKLPDSRASQDRTAEDDNDEESNDDDGDIEDDGQTKPLQSYSLRSQEHLSRSLEHASRSPERPRNAGVFAPPVKARPVTVSPTPQRTFHRHTITSSEEMPSNGSEVVQTVQASQQSQSGGVSSVPPITTGHATQPPARQAPTHSMGTLAGSNQGGQSAAPPTGPSTTAQAASSCEKSRTPAAEAAVPLNLSLPPRPPVPAPAATATAPAGPAPTPAAATAATTTAPTTKSSTSTQQKQSTPTSPAPGAKPHLTSTKAITPAQCLLGAGQILIQCAHIVEQDSKARTDQAAISRQRHEQSESMQEELRQKLVAQSKEIEELKSAIGVDSAASTRFIEQRKELDDFKSSKNEQLATLTKQLEELRENTQKAMKFQETFHGFEDWNVNFADMFRMFAMCRSGGSNRQSVSAGEDP
ncbi:hypothetical protein BDW62DRAFT_188964 [Aspergillus aurantiobrunneus]